jgi:hypothetical protein
MITSVKKRKRNHKNKRIKFIRFIACILIFSSSVTYLMSIIVNAINDKNVKDTSNLGVEITTNNVIDNSSIHNDEDVVHDDCNKYDLIKPDKLSDIHFEWIVEISNNEKVPLEVLLAIITTENSNYDENATSVNSNGTKDMGLCQINSAYVNYFAKTYNITNLDPYNVYDAVTFVARHMKYLSEYAVNKYNLSEIDSYIFAAGAYNRGLGNECKYKNMYSYKEKFVINYNTFI